MYDRIIIMIYTATKETIISSDRFKPVMMSSRLYDGLPFFQASVNIVKQEALCILWPEDVFWGLQIKNGKLTKLNILKLLVID